MVKKIFILVSMVSTCAAVFISHKTTDSSECVNTMPVSNFQDKDLLTALVACGSFSPITNAHLRMLESARDHLAKTLADLKVVKGFISPVGDAYGKKGLLPAHHRIEMARLAVADSPWIEVHSWEAEQQTYQRTLMVLKKIKEDLQAHYKKDVRILLVCGADLLESFNVPDLWSKEDQHGLVSNEFGIVAIQRNGIDLMSTLWKNEILWANQKNIFVVPMPEDNVSSTHIRSMTKRGMSVKYLTPSAVIEYIKQHNLYE